MYVLTIFIDSIQINTFRGSKRVCLNLIDFLFRYYSYKRKKINKISQVPSLK